jgi:hypothetical protein
LGNRRAWTPLLYFILCFVTEVDAVFPENYVVSVVVAGGLVQHFSLFKTVKSLITKDFFQTSGNTFYCVARKLLL